MLSWTEYSSKKSKENGWRAAGTDARIAGEAAETMETLTLTAAPPALRNVDDPERRSDRCSYMGTGGKMRFEYVEVQPI